MTVINFIYLNIYFKLLTYQINNIVTYLLFIILYDYKKI